MAETIAAKNDLCRITFIGCRVVMTEGVRLSPDRDEIITAVREFSSFGPDNDPYGEHDFGRVEVNEQAYFWKIDYFDEKYKFFEEDGRRVLTIMRTDEY